jgi:hypothetical protein
MLNARRILTTHIKSRYFQRSTTIKDKENIFNKHKAYNLYNTYINKMSKFCK